MSKFLHESMHLEYSLGLHQHIVLLLLHENICSRYSLELCDNSNEHPTKYVLGQNNRITISSE